MELLGATLGYAGGGFTGGLLGCGVGLALGSDWGCLFGAIFGGVAGAGFGVAIGVNLAGDAVDGNGSFWAAYLGQLLGGLASLATVPLAFESDAGLTTMLFAATVLPIAGGIIGYEISHDPETADSSRPSFTAAMIPTWGGAAARVAATF